MTGKLANRFGTTSAKSIAPQHTGLVGRKKRALEIPLISLRYPLTSYTQSPTTRRIAAQESVLRAILKQPRRRPRIERARNGSRM